jgi:hypothetical protein
MKVIYVAGPYRAINEYGVMRNIQSAGEVALAIWELGAAVICPHKNTAFFGGALPDSMWLRGDLEILDRCDALFAMYGWTESEGAKAEVDFAQSIGMPVFFTYDDLHEWIKENQKPEN